MSYASRSGRAKTSASNPQAFAVCERCSIWTNRYRLQNQREWRGAALLPINIWVCPDCYDTPQEQLRAIVLSADPLPVILPFPEPFAYDEENTATLTTGSTIDPITGIPIPDETTIGTTDGLTMTAEPYGRMLGLEQAAIMPLQTVDGVPTEYDVPVPFLSIMSSGADTVTVTCSAPHGLATTNQIAVQGLSEPRACGFFSVVVTTATAFTYQTYTTNLPGGSLLTSNVLMVTANVGIPYLYDQIQQIGP